MRKYKKYIAEAKEKATSVEKYAVENGAICGRYIDGKLILVFHALYDTVHKSIIYYNCVTHSFCNYKGV